MTLSAVDKKLELTQPQAVVGSSQPETAVDAKVELNTSVKETLEAVAAGKNVVDVVNVGCLERFAKLFCFLTVKNVVNAVDLSGSVLEAVGAAVEATVKDLDLSGSVLSNAASVLESQVAALESEVLSETEVPDLSGSLLNVLEKVASVDLSGCVLQNVVTAVETQKAAVTVATVAKVSALPAVVHEEAVYFVNKMISSSQNVPQKKRQ
uniref:Uncharacterized protein n=1 Tax=viral metagenome TaxID=1070528 RepID=A0A6C0IAA2_9ZZZZ